MKKLHVIFFISLFICAKAIPLENIRKDVFTQFLKIQTLADNFEDGEQSEKNIQNEVRNSRLLKILKDLKVKKDEHQQEYNIFVKFLCHYENYILEKSYQDEAMTEMTEITEFVSSCSRRSWIFKDFLRKISTSSALESNKSATLFTTVLKMKFEFLKRRGSKHGPLYAPNDEYTISFQSNSKLVQPFTYSYTKTHLLDNNTIQTKQNLMQRLSNWFEDHLPLRGRRSETRRADLVARSNIPSAQSKANCVQKSNQPLSHKTSRSAAPPRLRYSSASSDVAGRIYPYGRGREKRSETHASSHEEPAINYFKEYCHQEYDSDNEEECDEEEEFLLITTSGFAAAAARPHMASSLYAKSSHKDNIPQINGLSQSFTSASNGGGSCRQAIRTNPWIVRESDERLSSRSSCSAFHPPTRAARIAGKYNANLQATLSLRRSTPVRRVPCQGNKTEQHLALPIKNSNISCAKAEGWNLYASINRAANLNGLKALDESTCSASSGYGSQDSSPESSVHSPDWQPPSSLSSSTVGAISTCSMMERDKAMEIASVTKEEKTNIRSDKNGNSERKEYMEKRKSGNYEEISDEHIYHELECLSRLSLLLDDEQTNFNSEIASVASSSYLLSNEAHGLSHADQETEDETSSPIYAVPYETSSHARVFNSHSRVNNNSNDHYQLVKPLYRSVHLPSPRPNNYSTASNSHLFNNFPVQETLQISSPFFPNQSPWPEAHRQKSFVQTQKPSYTYHQAASNGLRRGIIVQAQPSFSDSSSEDDPEEELIEEGEQSSTSCSSWTPMRISPRVELDQRPCHFNAPPPPPIQQPDEKRPNEFDFLAELDQQIVELQHQSDAVRQLVEQAKERHELRSKTRQLCMEHLKELRKMRWFMHNNFELCL